jgi:hypothetical protein
MSTGILSPGLGRWVTIAAPSLPEKERNEILVMLMCSHLFLGPQTEHGEIQEHHQQFFINKKGARASVGLRRTTLLGRADEMIGWRRVTRAR